MEDQVKEDLEPVRTIAERPFPEESAEVLQRKKVWVNSKWLTSDNPKAEKYKPAATKEKVLWGLCRCGEQICEGDAVGMVGDHTHVVCYSCFATDDFPDHHLDCAGLRFPDETLSQ